MCIEAVVSELGPVLVVKFQLLLLFELSNIPRQKELLDNILEAWVGSLYRRDQCLLPPPALNLYHVGHRLLSLLQVLAKDLFCARRTVL